MNNQEAFTIAVVGMLAQGRRSTTNEGCQYYMEEEGGEPLCCAVGFLLPEDVRQTANSAWLVEKLVEQNGAVREVLGGVSITLLTELQEIHDYSQIDLWEIHLTALADRSSFTMPTPQDFLRVYENTPNPLPSLKRAITTYKEKGLL